MIFVRVCWKFDKDNVFYRANNWLLWIGPIPHAFFLYHVIVGIAFNPQDQLVWFWSNKQYI